jgi:hypothetical protein
LVDGFLLLLFEGREEIRKERERRRERATRLVFSFFLVFRLSRLGSDFFVVLFESSQILTSLGELSFFHTFSDVPVDESSLGVHEIELVINSAEDFGNGSGVGEHADGSLHLGKVSSRDDRGRLVVDTALESSGAPVYELNGSLGLDDGNSSIDVLGDDVSSVHEAASHVLAMSRVALGHHVGGLEDGVGEFGNGELFVVGLLCRDNWSVRAEHEVNSRIRHQVGLEFSHIDVEGTVEAERSSEGRNDLSNQSVEVGVSGTLNVEGTSADVVDGLVVEHESNISVFEEGVSGEHGVVGLNDCSGDLRRRIDAEVEFALLAVVHRESLKEKRAKTRASSSSNRVEDEETLKTSALVSKFSDSVEAEVNNFLSNGVVTTGVVVGCVFLSGDELLRVEELSIGSSSDFVNDGGFEVEEHATRDMLASSSFGEKSVEGIVTVADGLVGRHLSIGLNSVFEAEEFPAGVTSLDTSLTNVDRNDFSHG